MDWLETDAARDLGHIAITRKLELVGKSTTHVLLAAEQEAEELLRQAEADIAELTPAGAGRGARDPPRGRRVRRESARAPSARAPDARGGDRGGLGDDRGGPAPPRADRRRDQGAAGAARAAGLRGSAAGGVLVAGHVDVARAKRRALAGVRVVGVAPDAAGVVGQQVDRDRGLRRGGADAVDVVGRRDERVEVARARARGSRRARCRRRARRRCPRPGSRGRGRRGPTRGGRAPASARRRARRARRARASGPRRGTAATGRCRRPCRSRGRPPGSARAARRGRRAAAAKEGRIASQACAGDPASSIAARTPATKSRTTGCRAGTRRRPRGESMAGRERVGELDRSLVVAGQRSPTLDQPVEQLDLGADELGPRLVEREPLGPVDLGELLAGGPSAAATPSRSCCCARRGVEVAARGPRGHLLAALLHHGAELDQLVGGQARAGLLLELAQRGTPAGPRRARTRPWGSTTRRGPSWPRTGRRGAPAAPRARRRRRGTARCRRCAVAPPARAWSAGRRRRGRWRRGPPPSRAG